MSVDQLLQQSIAELAGVAARVEEGQARRPLYDRVAGLYELSSDMCLPVVVLSFRSSFFSGLVRCLIEDFPPDLVADELQINTGVNHFRVGGDLHSSNDREELHAQIRKALEEDSKRPLEQLALDGIDGIAPLKLMPANTQKLLDLDVTEFNRLINNTSMVIVTAPIDYCLTAEERAVMTQLLKYVRYLSVLALPAEGIQAEGKRWHQESIPVHVKTFPAATLSSEALPTYLVDSDSMQRKQILSYYLLDKLLSTAGLISSQVEDKIHYLDCCQEADEFTFSLLERDPELTAKIEQNRKALETLMGSLETMSKKLQDESKHSLVGKGAFYHMVETELEALQSADLEKEQVHNVYKLSVTSSVLKEISARLVRRLNGLFEDEAHKVQDSLNTLFSDSRRELVDWPSGLARTMGKIAGVNGVADNSEDHLDFKIRYKGEMPKRGFLKRIGEGRRAMFMVLMMFSIFGGMLGFNYRNYAFMSIFFIGLFAGGTIWTYFSWRKDDAFKMAGEVDKARDQLHSEYMRAVSEIERNRVRAIADGISGLAKCSRQEFEAWQKSAAEDIKESMDTLKEKGQSKKTMLKTELMTYGKLLSAADSILVQLRDIKGAFDQADEKLNFG